MNDLVVILVMAFPMLIFAIYPGIKLADWLEDKYKINESTKIKIIIISTLIFALSLSSFVHLA